MKSDQMITIEKYLQVHMKPNRLAHTNRVVSLAEKLAKIHGESVEKAKLAALLHDIAKSYSKHQIEEALGHYQLHDPYLSKNPFLAHGEIGACLAKEKFEIDDEDILNAIRFHTYGRRGMSPLEQIIYLADYCEEGRDFEGVSKLRQKALDNLDKAMFFASVSTIKHLMASEAIVHPNALEVYNEWLERHKETK